MRALPLPPSGPITVDCRERTVSSTLRALDDTLRRMRAGPRLLVVRVATDDVLDVATRWARSGHAQYEVVHGDRGTEVRVYLLPLNLGGHPAAAFQRPPRLAPQLPALPGEHRPAV